MASPRPPILVAASHQWTTRIGSGTTTPAGTSMSTASGRKASLRRTSASPPTCTLPTIAGPSATSSQPPNPRRPLGARHAEREGLPVVHHTLSRQWPEDGRHRVAEGLTRLRSGRKREGDMVTGTNSSRLSSSMGVYRQTSSLSAGIGDEAKAARPAARRSRSHGGPARAAEPSALNVCRVNLFRMHVGAACGADCVGPYGHGSGSDHRPCTLVALRTIRFRRISLPTWERGDFSTHRS
jgi:hypothetical protein